MEARTFNLQHLRLALSNHLGQSLTPEAAAHIEAIATSNFDASHEPAAFCPVRYKGFIFHVERLRDIVDEIHPLHVEHWLETEGYRHGLLCNPDYEAMLADERDGRLIQFTVRKDGELVGNCRMYVGKSRHTQLPTSTEDTLFLTEKARGGFTAMQFVRYIEANLRSLGVREISIDSKVSNKAHVLMKRLGYPLVGYRFTKIYPEHNHVQ